MNVTVHDEELTLLPERALWWARAGLLALSDVHLGRSESLQREGLPIPTEAGASDLARLGELVGRLAPREVLILGDFIHQRTSWSRALKAGLAGFFARHRGPDWTLILGNHERGSRAHLEELPLTLVTGHVARPPFRFTHGHETAPGGDFTVAGHRHPVVTLREGPLRLRFPCFVLDARELTLPSFGTWTGGHEIQARARHRYFAATPREVFEIDLD